DLQVVDPGTTDVEIFGELHESLAERLAWAPDRHATGLDQRTEETRGLCGPGRPPPRGRVGDDGPELAHTGRSNAPAALVSSGSLDGPASCPVLRRRGAVSVHEQVRVGRDHLWRSSQSCMRARSATSQPGGSPPRTVTHLMRRGRAAALERRPAPRPARRTASSIAPKGLGPPPARLFGRVT